MRHPRTLQAITIAAISVLVPWGAGYLTDTAPDDASGVASAALASCAPTGDVFQLDVPGTYVAFAIDRSGPLLTEVEGSHGDLLATSRPMIATAGVVDLASGVRFGIPPPQVFEVTSSVMIDVEHNRSTYELVVVRIDGARGFSGFRVRPPVEPITDESWVCPGGGLGEVFKIRTDAVYSDPDARQIFVIDSPYNSSTTESRSSGSGAQHERWLETWRSPAMLRSIWVSRFFALG